jgi:HK97 family phage major capsid protein
MALVNADDFIVNGILAELTEDANILGALSTTGQPVFTTDANGQVARVLGRPFAETYVDLDNGARFIVGDWKKLSVAIVNDLSFKKFDSGSVNISGTEYNLIERNMVAVRAEARLMFKVTQANAFAYLYS